jgi:hypothetical protein
MMKKIFDFFMGHKYAILWTIGYFCVVWAILYFLFNFDFLNAVQWHRLFRAHLRGFPGFVFGLLVLAALPLYVATTTIIVRKKQPLITIPVPDIKKIPALIKKKAPEPVKEEKQEVAEKDEDKYPKDLPIEMRRVFMRAKQNLLFLQQSGGQLPDAPETKLEEILDVVETLPVPTDFDFDVDVEEQEEENGFGMPVFGESAPVFKSLSFDDDDESEVIEDENDGLANKMSDNSNLVKYLSDKKFKFDIDEDVVLTDKYAIATHSDKDFWVVDSENWFAAGKVCTAPTLIAKRAAEKYGLVPAIYLEAKNILDIDKLIPQWQEEGIKVITDLQGI